MKNINQPASPASTILRKSFVGHELRLTGKYALSLIAIIALSTNLASFSMKEPFDSKFDKEMGSQELSDQLFTGCNKGDIDLVKKSLEKGAKLDQITCGSTPLGVACCWSNNSAIVELLLSKDADINQLNDRNETALKVAIDRLYALMFRRNSESENEILNLKNIIKILLNNPKLDLNQIVHSRSNNVIHYVVGTEFLFENEIERVATISNLLKNNKTTKDAINKTNKDLFTPIYIACQHKNLAVVEILLANGADANQIIERENLNYCLEKGDSDESPLYVACKQKNVEMFDLLLKQGHANINLTFRNGSTLLHKLCKIDDFESLEFFIKNCENYKELNFDIDQVVQYQDSFYKNSFYKSFTPLHLACQFERPKIVKLLLEHGANANKVIVGDNYRGWAPINFICFSALLFSDTQHVRNIIEKLLKYGADINGVIQYGQYLGYTPLRLVCCIQPDNLNIIKLLLEFGAKIDNGSTLEARGKQPILDLFNLTTRFDEFSKMSDSEKTWLEQNQALPIKLREFAEKLINRKIIFRHSIFSKPYIKLPSKVTHSGDNSNLTTIRVPKRHTLDKNK